MQACVRLDDEVCSGRFAVEQSLRQGCILAPLLSNIVFPAVVNVVFTRFKVEEDIMDEEAGRRGEQPPQSQPW